jgi:hypothetical protein
LNGLNKVFFGGLLVGQTLLRAEKILLKKERATATGRSTKRRTSENAVHAGAQ